MSNDLLFQLGQDVGEKELTEAIACVQEFDPPGVCARSLQECLLLQLCREESASKICNVTKVVIERYFEEFARKNYSKIMDLSEKRAKAVVDFLVRGGIAMDRVGSKGFGSTRSVAPNDSEEGRALNRRTEVEIE